jgi:hypothetical protein
MDFDQLYEEAGHRRRMMSVSAHEPHQWLAADGTGLG